MDKCSDAVSLGMREVAELRDKRLRKTTTAISPHRLEALHAALAAEFPVETAFRAAANNRDESIEHSPVLPAGVELLLHRRLLAQQRRADQRGALQRWATAVQASWGAFHSATRLAAAVALIVFAMTTLHFGGFRSHHGSELLSHNAPRPYLATQSDAKSAYERRVEQSFLRKSGDELTLRVSTIELASLQSSLFSINRALLAEGHDFDRSLPLDLPIRQLLSDRDASGIP